MRKGKAKLQVRKTVQDEHTVAPDVLQRVGIESHDPATCTCEECIELRLKMPEEDRKAA